MTELEQLREEVAEVRACQRRAELAAVWCVAVVLIVAGGLLLALYGM